MIAGPPPGYRQAGLLACLLFSIALAACSAPVKVERVDLHTAYEDLNRTALSSNQLSETTRTVLRRAALLDTFDVHPDAVIAALRAQAIATGMHWPDLYALAEMSYFEGRRTKSKTQLLASALYAYAVLFPSGNADKPSPYTAQFQHATNFYNLALTQVLSGAGAEGVANLQSSRHDLPFGTVDVTVDQASLTFAGRTLTSFVPTMNLEVKASKTITEVTASAHRSPLVSRRHRSAMSASCCRQTSAYPRPPSCKWTTRGGNSPGPH